MGQLKSKSFYKKQLTNIIKLVSKKYPEVLKWKIDANRFCIDRVYRDSVKGRLLRIEQNRERSRRWRKNNRERHRESCREWVRNNREHSREIKRRYRITHPEVVRAGFQRWAINNPRKAMLCAAASRIAIAVIDRLGIRPTVCPHCGRSNCNIEFHHPNHLFWWKGTFCCKSCHYYFNRDKVPAADKIIDLKKLLRESISH